MENIISGWRKDQMAEWRLFVFKQKDEKRASNVAKRNFYCFSSDRKKTHVYFL